MSNYTVEGTLVNGELVGKPKLTVPHNILLKFLDLMDFYQNLENKDAGNLDKELDFFIQKSIARTVAKYNVNKREKKIQSELKQWSESLQLFFYDLEDQNNET
jgi:hypothetical protein